MSRLKSLFYSMFTAPRRRYDIGAFGEEYFSPGEPDTRRARRYVEIFEPESVLDVGCGTGRLVHGFRLAGVDARGTEAAVAAIECADVEVKPYLETGSILDIDRPDESFDLVTCIDVLEHIPSSLVDKAVSELYRVARSHVLLNICLWTERNARMDPTHIHLRSRRYWQRKFRSLGYALRDIPEDLPFAYNAFIIQKQQR